MSKPIYTQEEMQPLFNTIIKLEAENKLLRDALETLSRPSPVPNATEYAHGYHAAREWAQSIARKALEAK